jgi:hypothetical protein
LAVISRPDEPRWRQNDDLQMDREPVAAYHA